MVLFFLQENQHKKIFFILSICSQFRQQKQTFYQKEDTTLY